MRNIFYLVSILSLLFIACDPVENPPEPLFSFQENDGFFLLSEGGFTKGNSSVDYIYREQDSIVNDVYQAVNGSTPGDVLHSAVLHGSNLYMVLNNSGYIKIVDVETFEEIGEISGFQSPRYMQIINNNKAYVSDLYADKIWIVNLQNETISDSIELGARTEEMVLVNNKVYVSSPTTFGKPTSSSVYVIDTQNDEVADTINLRANPYNLIADENDQVHVFCQGDAFAEPVIIPSMHSINTEDHSDIKVKILPNLPSAFQSRLALSPDHEYIYLLFGNLYIMDNLAEGLSFVSIPYYEANDKNLYGMSVDPTNGNIYLSDAGDYNERGSIISMKPNAVLLNEFKSGVIPSTWIWY